VQLIFKKYNYFVLLQVLKRNFDLLYSFFCQVKYIILLAYILLYTSYFLSLRVLLDNQSALSIRLYYIKLLRFLLRF
jgi:hypothetical protein